ncbi:C-terminal processing peptidase-3. Serine peptidase. MEROPS family S41A [Bacteroidales bacterium WCE2004]|nr:C-terminal processing peptidase-3. Serine peptidase. MEROPS family S41A [Bacteroidales bacterium WCE2004]
MKKSSILVALLGVVIGLLIAVLVGLVGDRRHRLRVGSDDWRKIELVLQSIDENYVDSVDHEKVNNAMAAAALSALDPHSSYMPPQVLEETEADLLGNFDGIGIQFNVPNDTAVVIEAIPGGPSEKIGLQAGDRLIKVDSTVIAGVHFPQDSMVRRLKGVAGTKVLVTVKRGHEIIPFEITRGKIPTYSVDAAFMVSDTTGYLRLSKFSRTTEVEFLQNTAELVGQGMKELILDLRDNTGGYLDQACRLSNFFLPRKAMIVYIEGRHRRREEFRADGRGPFQDLGVKILVDEGSASASEILSGALQDNGRARLYGRRTFGKGLVQEPFFFSDNSGMRITVARYYTPSGRCIQKPYSDDYDYEVLRRYESGEMVHADSMRIEKGGILPDVFVPVDTTRAGQFYVACNRKATAMRFASAFFDSHSHELSQIDDYGSLLAWLDRAGLERQFLAFAKAKDQLVPKPEEWVSDRQYIMTQVQALVGRYSKLGDKAYYHLFLQIDPTFKAAMEE